MIRNEQPPKRQATIKDVAALAGVSPMTVSRTLSGAQSVRPEQRRKVRDAVAMLDYHRNENARSMRPGHSSGLIGVAITNLGNPYYGQFALGVEEVAAKHGRRILLGNSGEDLARERQLISDFVGRKVEGLIVVPTGGSSEHLMRSRAGNLPLVLASRSVSGVDADAVVLDDIGASYRATSALIEAGHTRIAFLGNAVSVSTAERRHEGFARAHADHGIPIDPRLIQRGQQDVASARIALSRLLELPDPPTAVFSANNRNTIGALLAIGYRPDREHSVAPTLAAFDDVELSELMPVPMIVMAHDPKELGARAAEMLFGRIDGTVTDPTPRLVELAVTVTSIRTPDVLGP
ncbi:LacI family DNA-binding transcriptional regulator [Rathayibacter soli]|uniref:LacI family DNA-binding transcriptional regulator n=1 Tax=Rathayibacter soli TaxID=3144168 RepID=UPI0027E3E3C5|nr:LacI family DNA-binding transcriptional regulator [Glaciibacter superstes]